MSAEQGDLREVTDYRCLMDLLESELPVSLTLLGWMKSRMRWQEKCPGDYPFKVYCPKGVMRDGLVAFGDMDSRIYVVTILTFDGDFSKLSPLLRTTTLIKWKEAVTVGVNMEHLDEVRDMLEGFGCRILHDYGSRVWQLSLEDAASYDVKCPSEFYLSPIRATDIPKVNFYWSLKFDGSEKNLLDLININGSVGLYTRQDNKLVCWCVECEYSEIGVLYTEHEYRRRGLAQLVVNELSKKLVKDKELVITYTIFENNASERLFENLGFKHVCDYGFVEYDMN